MFPVKENLLGIVPSVVNVVNMVWFELHGVGIELEIKINIFVHSVVRVSLEVKPLLLALKDSP